MKHRISPETSVLKPLNDELSEPSSWPVFTLTDVDVSYADDPTTIADLLGALSRERRIVGRLEALPTFQRHLLQSRKSSRAQYIVLDHVAACAYRLDSNNELMLRAVGRAGFYNLRPSETYASTWDDMAKKARILSWLNDFHKPSHSSTKRAGARRDQIPLTELFEAYSQHCYNRSDKWRQAAHELYSAHDLIIDNMLADPSPIDWSTSTLYEDLLLKYPDVFAAKGAGSENADPGDDLETTSGAKDLPIRGSGNDLKRKRGRVSIAHDHAAVVNRGKGSKPDFPSTPKQNPEVARRRFAMKGRSALRPSAVKPPYHRSGLSDDDGTNGWLETPYRMPQRSPSHASSDHQSNDVEESDSNSEERSANGTVSETIEEDDADLQVWTCNVPGCKHQLTASSLPDAQLLLDEHTALHAYDGDARVQLVKQLEHASLPVSHLMERVRMRARADELSTSLSNG